VQALKNLHPQVVSTIGDIAYDANGNEVSYDLDAVTTQAQANAQNIIDTKNSAISKLSALGLTEAEVKAILGTA
jgi:hypothetical protein